MRKWMTWVGCMVLAAGCQKQDGSSGAAVTVAAAGPAASACTLDVGWDPWEPYQYEDADGSVRGLDVEIVREVAKSAGCDVTFMRGNWKDLLAGVKKGEVDILLGATATPERESYASFSPPYRHETFVVLTRAGDAEALGKMDLAQIVQAGRRVGVTEGYYYGDATTKLMQDEKTHYSFVQAPVVELNYTRLLAGEVDALLDDPMVAAAVLRRKGIGGQVVRVPAEITSGDVSFMYSRAGVTNETVQRLNASIDARKKDGTLARMIEKYQAGLAAATPSGAGGSTAVSAP